METLNVDSFKTKVFDFDKNEKWVYAGTLPAIVDFYADWCGPCKILAPILEEVSQEYAGKVAIYKVDTEATPELASLFGIRGIPSLLFIPPQGEPTMSSGVLPKEILKEAIADLLKVPDPNPSKS
ncbi:thioredoxin [bacterium]|nr:thioredoxin [bacterium]